MRLASSILMSMTLAMVYLPAGAQSGPRVCVEDQAGHPLVGAAIASGGGVKPAVTGPDGCAVFAVGAGSAMVRLAGFESRTVALTGVEVRLALRPASVEQAVTVMADRGLAGIDDSAASVALLSTRQLAQAPGLALDDRLHSVAGFQLFRRTSSWTANPTSQGLSLRGLGSTAASRTLVVSDQVPLNDAFGGWVHWDEVPALAIEEVGLLRGGAADLYGSSAIGGVVDVLPVEPAAGRSVAVAADASGATEDTGAGDALVSAATGHTAALGAVSVLSTGGYIPTAPAVRGTVDMPANVTSESSRLELRAVSLPRGDDAFLRGNVLNESRANGTPLQTNATRLWRYAAGADGDSPLGHGVVRIFGSREGYRQSFSAIAADRGSERLTRLQRVPTDEFGVVLQGSRAFAGNAVAALGLDLRDIRATDAETSVANSAAPSTTDTSARQRETGGYADAIWQPGAWSASGSIRVDSFRTFDARQTVTGSSAVTALPEIDEIVASPRIGLVRRLPRNVALSATAFRAFRGPTMNELYRTGQVGQQTTLANASLLAERATGFEAGTGFSRDHVGHLRATAFWTEVNRPVSAVLLSATATTQTLKRENLGQIRSRGFMLEGQSQTWRGFDIGFGYQLAFATVTQFDANSAAQNNLTGKWIPQVPREAVTSTVNYMRLRLAGFHLIASYTGEQFDDAENQYLLHPFLRIDLSADHDLGHGLSVFAASQNLLNRNIDAGRTPLLTLASPRLVQAGLRYNFSR